MSRSIIAVSEALLERFVLGELDDPRMEDVRRRCESDPMLKARIEAIKASTPAILKAYPAAQMAAAIRKRRVASQGSGARPDQEPTRDRNPAAGRKPSSLAEFLARLSRVRYAVPVFATLIIGLFLMARPDRDGGAAPGESLGNTQVTVAPEIRLKGAESGLAIFRKTRSGSELLPPHSSARAGDTLQVFYHSLKVLYGIVFSMDGAGSITLHYPEANGPAAALQAGDLLPLPHAFRLDKAPRFERFYLITSPEPFGSESILAGLRRGNRPGQSAPDTLAGLAGGFRQYTYTIDKEGPRKNAGRKGTEK